VRFEVLQNSKLFLPLKNPEYFVPNCEICMLTASQKNIKIANSVIFNSSNTIYSPHKALVIRIMMMYYFLKEKKGQSPMNCFLVPQK